MNAEKEKLFILRTRAEKVVDLIDLMNDVFPSHPRENAILACMACIQDAYNVAKKDFEDSKCI